MFDDERQELRKHSAIVALEPQPGRFLALLLSRRGELVTRDVMIHHLWQGHTVNYTEGLHYCVAQVRRALADDSKHPLYVETVPRRGYRFIAQTQSPARRAGLWPFALSCAAIAALVVVAESVPNNHHEQTVRLLQAIHGVVF